MSGDSYISENHAIYFYSNGATEKQCYKIIKDIHIKLNDNNEYTINYLNTYGYIWVYSRAIFNELIKICLPEDELYENIIDPNWKKPDIDLEIELKNYDDNLSDIEIDWDKIPNTLSSSWDEEDEKRNEIIKKHTPNMIRKKIKTLLTNEDISFIDEYANIKQIKFMKTHMIMHKKYNPNILITPALPDWINIKMIIPHFKPYLSNRFDEETNRNYPIISKNKKNKFIRIELDPKEKDNMFYRLIKYSIKISNPDDENDDFIIYFNYANL